MKHVANHHTTLVAGSHSKLASKEDLDQILLLPGTQQNNGKGHSQCAQNQPAYSSAPKKTNLLTKPRCIWKGNDRSQGRRSLGSNFKMGMSKSGYPQNMRKIPTPNRPPPPRKKRVGPCEAWFRCGSLTFRPPFHGSEAETRGIHGHRLASHLHDPRRPG